MASPNYNPALSRYLPNGRFLYASGYNNRGTAYDRLCSMCNEGELSEHEGRIEFYTIRVSGKPVTRYGISVPG